MIVLGIYHRDFVDFALGGSTTSETLNTYTSFLPMRIED